MIRYDQIRDRIESMRSDKKGREGQLAFQIGARRLAVETLALQEIVIFTMPLGALVVEPYSQKGALSTEIVEGDGSTITVDTSTWEAQSSPYAKESLFIFKAEWLDTSNRWNGLILYNEGTLDMASHRLVPTGGFMRAYTSDHGRFRPNRPPVTDTQIRARVAYQPTGDFDEVRFSHQFEDALVEGALSHFYRLPGPGRDLAAASESEAAFNALSAGLRGVTLIGEVGYHRGSSTPRKRANWSRFLGHDTLEF